MPDTPVHWPTTPEEETYWDGVREAFLSDPDQAYLNTGSWGVLPRVVYDRVVAELRERELDPTMNRLPQVERVRWAREQLGRLLHTPPEDIAFVTNVTVAMNFAVNGLTWEPGDEIVASDQEYGAINNLLHYATQRWGVTLRQAEIPIPPSCPEDVLRAFEAAFTDRTRLVLCSHITSGTGLIVPIRELAELVHTHGALIAIDGAHGPGQIPLDLPDLGCDFYGGNCHKWLCSPKGVGFLYAAPHVQERITPSIAGFGYSPDGPTRDTDTGRPLSNDRPYMWGIEEIGTFSMAEKIATGDAVLFLEGIGMDRTVARTTQLAGYVRQRMAEYEWAELHSPTHPQMSGAMSAFELTGFGDLNMRDVLAERYGVTTASSRTGPPHRLRVSTHYYTTFAEIDRLVDALVELHAEA